MLGRLRTYLFNTDPTLEAVLLFGSGKNSGREVVCPGRMTITQQPTVSPNTLYILSLYLFYGLEREF